MVNILTQPASTEMLKYSKVKRAGKETLDTLVQDFIDHVIDEGYTLVDIQEDLSSHVYYYLKNLSWT